MNAQWNGISGVAKSALLITFLLLAFQVEADGASDAQTTEYANAFRISAAEAERRLEVEKDARDLKSRISEKDLRVFGGISIEHEPKHHVVVRFTGNAASHLARYTKDENFVARSVPRPLDLIKAVQQEATSILSSAGVRYMSTLDLDRSIVIIEVPDPQEASLYLNDLLKEYEFIVMRASEDFPDLFSIRGGLSAYGLHPDSRPSNHTLGFNVVDATGQVGVVSAGHVADSITHVDGDPVQMEFQGEINSGSVDLQWHRQLGAPGTLRQQQNEVYMRNIWIPVIQVNGVLNHKDLDKGVTICKSGHATGYTCGMVMDPAFRYEYGGEEGEYVLVAPLGETMAFAAGGDSGGPVLGGVEAAGLVHGGWSGIDSPRFGQALVMPVDRFSTLGLSVIVEPFSISSIADVAGPQGVDIPARVDFNGHPLFPVVRETKTVQCAPGWSCSDYNETYLEASRTPLEFAFRCNSPMPMPTATFVWRTTLTGADGVTTSAVEHRSVCNTP